MLGDLVRVYTHQQSQVKSDSQRHCRQCLEYLLWLHIGMHTHWQSRVKSHESCQVKSRGAACLIFVSWTPVISMTAVILHWVMNVERIIFLIKGHQAINNASHFEQGTEAK